MVCTDAALFNWFGEQQYAPAQLNPTERANATNSLYSINPFYDAAIHARFAALVVRGLPYFIVGSDGCPYLMAGSGHAISPPPAPPPPAASFPPIGTEAPAPAPAAPPAAPPPSPAPQVPSPPSAPAPAAQQLAAVTPGAITLQPGQPCPPGYELLGTAAAPSATVREQVLTAYAPLQEQFIPALAGCALAPTAGRAVAVGMWVTTDDCLRVLVFPSGPVPTLQLVVRMLDCQGDVVYMAWQITGLAVNAVNVQTFPLAPGWILNLSVSVVNANLDPGVCFVGAGLQHTCAANTPYEVIFAQGYVSTLWAIGWPSTSTGTAAPSTASGGNTGVGFVVQYRGRIQSTASTVTLSLPQVVTAGNLLVACIGSAQQNVGDGIVSTPAQTWALAAVHGAGQMWYAANAVGGNYTITFTAGNPQGLGPQMHVYEISGPPPTTVVDVNAIGGGVSPITVTTGSTSFFDVVVAMNWNGSANSADFVTPSGYTLFADTINSDARRLASYVAQALALPPATATFTSTVSGTSSLDVLLAGFSVHS